MAHYPSPVAEIGLFPLALVLAPTERVPLHIFEPRYKELIGECIADAEPFGLLLEDDAGRRDIGTLAGVQGGRARVRRRAHEHPRRGRGPLPGHGVDRRPLVPHRRGGAARGRGRPRRRTRRAPSEALALFRQLADVADAEIEEPDGASGSLAFEIAAHVDFGTQPKQELLELRSERERLRRLTELLEQALAAMTREREIRERAATNGRVSLELGHSAARPTMP